MQTKRVAFLGIDKYQIMHFMSRILLNMQKKVLLIDQSETGALTASIPMPENYKGILTDYRGIDFSCDAQALCSEITDNYDYVFIDFGFEVKHSAISQCDFIILVTDMQLYQAKRLNVITLSHKIPTNLVLMNVIYYKIQVSHIIEHLSKYQIDSTNVFEVERCDEDYKQQLDCLYNTVVPFKRCSRGFKQMVTQLVHQILGEESQKVAEVKRALIRAERGM